MARLGAGGGGIVRLLPLVFRVLGFKGTLIAIVLVVGYSYFSGDLERFLGSSGLESSQTGSTSQPVKQSAAEKQLVEFVSSVLADTEDSWNELFRQSGKSYREPKLVLFRQAVATACGTGSAQIGPFYCPSDQKVYLDLSFFDELKSRHGAPGDFAQAYVIAHEIGHHVQTLSGISEKVHKAKKSLSQVEANRLSVKQELQADCYAGIWAHDARRSRQNRLSVKQELQADCYAGIWAHDARRSRQILEAGDIEEGLAAASAIGDDRLQKQARGYVTPDSFTHGSSEQRVAWFRKGLSEGTLKACDTFAAGAL
jgi:predicted metalloprotease